MKCTEIQNLLLDYAYGVLEESEEQLVEQHLHQCAACQNAWQAAKNQKSLIKEATVEAWPDVRFDASLLTDQTPSWQQSKKNQKPHRPYFGFLLALAALLLLQIAPLWIYFSSHEVNRQAQADQATTKQIEEIQKERNQLAQVYETALAEEVKKLGNYPKVTVQMDQGPGKHVTLGMQDSVSDQKLQVQIFQGDQKIGETTLSKELPSEGFAFPGEKIQGPLILKVREGKKDETISVPLFDFTTFLHLDRASYRPGETVRYRSITLNRVGFTPIDTTLALRYFLIGPDGEKEVGRGNGELHIESGAALLNALGKPVKGVGVGGFQIPADAKNGLWKVEVRDALNRFQPVSQPIQLVARTALNLYHEIRFDKAAYFPGDRAKATIRAWDLNNLPLAKQKMILTLAFGGVAHQIDGTPMKRGKIEKETQANGETTVEFQIPPTVAAGSNEMVVQIPSGEAFSSIAATIPLFLNRPVITVRSGAFQGAAPAGSVLVWATDEQGNPSPLKGHWKAKNSGKICTLKPITTGHPLGLYESRLEPAGPESASDWELIVQGPGEPQTLPLPNSDQTFEAYLGPSHGDLFLRAATDGHALCQVVKNSRVLAQKEIHLSGNQPHKENFGGIFAESGLYLIRLEQKTARGPLHYQQWVNAGDPKGPVIESEPARGTNRFFLKGPDGSNQPGLAFAMIYQEGSPWEENGRKASLISWLAQMQSENLAPPRELAPWLAQLPQEQRGSFLSCWLTAFPAKAQVGAEHKSLAIQNPFLQPLTKKLKALSQQLDESYEKTNQKLLQLRNRWEESAPAREKAQEKSHSSNALFWGMGLVQMAGVGFVLVLHKGLSRGLYLGLILFFAVCSILGWVGLRGATAQSESPPRWDTLLASSVQQGSSTTPPGGAKSVPLSVDGHPKGSGFPLEAFPSRGGLLQPFWVDGADAQVPQEARPVVADHPSEWPMPAFIAEKKGVNHAEASSYPQLYEPLFRGNYPDNLAQYPLIYWDPCLVFGKSGWKAPELAPGTVKTRIFLFAVSETGGIACLDQPFPR